MNKFLYKKRLPKKHLYKKHLYKKHLYKKHLYKSTHKREDGFFTLWVLGLSVCLMFVGGLALEMWRATAEKSALSAMADGAAIAAVSHIDIAAFKNGERVGSSAKIDQAEARNIAIDYVSKQSSAQKINISDINITTTETGIRITLESKIQLSLTKVLLPGESDITIMTSGEAEARIS